MPVLPGGKIISGVGGRLWISNIQPGFLAPTRALFQGSGGLDPKGWRVTGAPNPLFLDVQQWSIARTTILAEIPHSGCVGGVTRRVLGYTWRFSASLPLDQSRFPESLLIDDSFAIAFYLGDVTINPEAVYMNMNQAYYFSPRVCLTHIGPVLNATGDVIRINISGEESCRLFLIPTEQDLCDKYITYLNVHKGWL